MTFFFVVGFLRTDLEDTDALPPPPLLPDATFPLGVLALPLVVFTPILRTMPDTAPDYTCFS
ncbi:MAG: hypothetical protein V6Z81_03335 [Parvularculales bacterium]